MKCYVRLVCAVVLCGLAFTMLAAQQPKEEQIKPELFFVIQEHVKPGKHKDYETATKQLVDTFTQYKINPEDVNFETISGPEFGYIYVIPLKDFGDMETIQNNWMQAIDVIGADRWEQMETAMTDTMASKNAFHVARLNELCYEPAKPALAEDDVAFLHYMFFYVTPGSEKKFEALAARFKDLYSKHDVAHGWSFFKKVTGDELPVYVVVARARSEAEYHKNAESVRKTLGSEGEALMAEAMSYTRKIEKMAGTPRPELSYPNPSTTEN